jgi:cell wall-associated NlpC family hydrolase
MAIKPILYQDARERMKAGDVIAFSGKGNFSEIIKWATRSGVSHVGVIIQSKLLIGDQAQDGMFNQIIESTTLNGFSGVTISRLSDRLDTYDGEIWWLPIRKNIDEKWIRRSFMTS